MTAQLLKDRIIKSIEGLNDKRVLESLLNIIQLESDESSIFHFNEEQVKIIKEAQVDIKTGLTQTDEEVNQEIDEWLNA